jgi:hypothetical protein
LGVSRLPGDTDASPLLWSTSEAVKVNKTYSASLRSRLLRYCVYGHANEENATECEWRNCTGTFDTEVLGLSKSSLSFNAVKSKTFDTESGGPSKSSQSFNDIKLNLGGPY